MTGLAHHRHRGALVSNSFGDGLRIERGALPDIAPDKVALIAQYSARNVQPKSLGEYIAQLSANDFLPIVISTCPSDQDLAFCAPLPQDAIILRRPNIGYDFGSWSTALTMVPQIRSSRVVLLTNDSQLGPFAPIDHLLDWICEPGPDIRALTLSHQFVRHVQSYFLAFRGGILDDEPWRHFFDSIRQQSDKMSVVTKYEIGVSRLAFSEGYSVQALLRGSDLGVPNGNPTIDGWSRILDRGVPFVKRTLLTHPSTLKDASEVRTEILKRFATDVEEW